jgi:anti-sigma regulatory factor (Ser/Thr protein kinase)
MNIRRDSAPGVPPDLPEDEERLTFETIGYEEFAPRPESVAEVRRFVGQTLASRHGNVQHVFECQLIADELATNAVTHAATSFSVAVEVSETSIRIAVRDDEQSMPVLRETPILGAAGRGLSVVSNTADEWGAESLGRGKEAWADIDTSPHLDEEEARRTSGTPTG